MAWNQKRSSVIVSICMISLVFVVLFGFNYRLQQYWSDQNTHQMINSFAQSEVNAGHAAPSLAETIPVGNTNLPVLSMTVTKQGGILSEKKLAGSSSLTVPPVVVRQILSEKPGNWKAGSYIYSLHHLNDDQSLIVITNARSDHLIKYHLATCAALSAGESILLAPITIYLSRVISRPSRRSLREEKAFVSDASHELKTSLGAIGINAQALVADMGDNVHLKNILSETENMSLLTERLLTLSRVQDSTFSCESFPLSDTVEEVALSYMTVAYERGVGLFSHIVPDLKMTGMQDDIRQLVSILTDNAVKYTEPGGEIHVYLNHEHQTNTLKVTNTGTGISQKDLPHIFERFYTTDTSGDHRSFGLGLAIAKAIVQKHHGRISASSTPGKLTVFRVDFPTKTI